MANGADRSDDPSLEKVAIPDPTAPGQVVRDAETVELIGEFLAETADALGRVDALLIEIERAGIVPEAIHKLFRAFHTVKGTAGFLALTEIIEVAHTTETLLEQCRSGSLPLAGEPMELVFEATEVTRSMAEAIRLAVQRGEEIAHVECASLLQRMRVVTEAGAGAHPEAAPVAVAPPPPTPKGPAFVVRKARPGEVGGPPRAAPKAKPTAPEAEPGSREGVLTFLGEASALIERFDFQLIDAEGEGRPAEAPALLQTATRLAASAGLAGLDAVGDAAVAAERLLQACVAGTVRLEGPAVDALLEATGALRDTLIQSRKAAEEDRPQPPAPAPLAEAIARLRAVAEGQAPAEEDPGPAEPGARLGDILASPPLNLSKDVIDGAAERQRRTGRRLGEELVASGAVRSADLAKALRAQSRAARPEGRGPARLRETVKVDVERLDGLLETIGELVVIESMMRHVPELAGETSERARACVSQLAKVTRDLQDASMRMRMVPVEALFRKMGRIARDTSHRLGKKARLVTQGEATEMDRIMVEQVADPLLHMIRNAIDHGIETPEEREKVGKPPGAVVRLSASHEGGSVIIEVADDGRGLDRARILAKAKERGLVARADALTDADVDHLIFAPGFSTASVVTETSGRGVGMDVVKRNVEALRGQIQIASTPGQGTTFRIVLPLTLAIIDGMLVASGEERFILPTLSVVESLRPERESLVAFAGQRELLDLRGQTLPLVRLDRALEIDGARQDPAEALVVVVETLGSRFGLVVDEVVSQQQVVIKSLGEGLNGASGLFSGAAVMGDGRVGLILALEALAQRAMAGGRSTVVARASSAGRESAWSAT